MSFSFERLFTVELYCHKCAKLLTVSPNRVYIGATVFECKECNYEIIIEVV